MGRIKGTIIKRATKELLKKYPSEFTTNYEENKKVVVKYVKQKKFRNSIAGYITRLKRKQKEESETTKTQKQNNNGG